MKPSLTRVVRSAHFLFLSVAAASGMTLEELRSDPNLSPETFATHFSNFKFAFNAVVLKPDVFLSAEAGDCDDYSTLAAAELGLRGYHGRLVSVRMKNLVHVVCYITEAKGYLDYNLRAQGSGLVPCGSELPDMADTVAKSFKLNWTSVSEFTFNDGVKRLVKTTLARDLQVRN